jgi:hypothetical protein
MTLVILDVVADTVGMDVVVAALVDAVGLDVAVAALVDAVGLAPLTGEVAPVEQATIPGKINSIKIH